MAPKPQNGAHATRILLPKHLLSAWLPQPKSCYPPVGDCLTELPSANLLTLQSEIVSPPLSRPETPQRKELDPLTMF
jgi:hypothetical protein